MSGNEFSISPGALDIGYDGAAQDDAAQIVADSKKPLSFFLSVAAPVVRGGIAWITAGLVYDFGTGQAAQLLPRTVLPWYHAWKPAWDSALDRPLGHHNWTIIRHLIRGFPEGEGFALASGFGANPLGGWFPLGKEGRRQTYREEMRRVRIEALRSPSGAAEVLAMEDQRHKRAVGHPEATFLQRVSAPSSHTRALRAVGGRVGALVICVGVALVASQDPVIASHLSFLHSVPDFVNGITAHIGLKPLEHALDLSDPVEDGARIAGLLGGNLSKILFKRGAIGAFEDRVEKAMEAIATGEASSTPLRSLRFGNQAFVEAAKRVEMGVPTLKSVEAAADRFRVTQAAGGRGTGLA